MRMLPTRLRCLKTLSLVGGAVWVGVGDVTLPEKVLPLEHGWWGL